MFRPLTSSNVESHLKNVGLDAEFATHHRISALSGGQKVKVVLGAAMWMQPHLVRSPRFEVMRCLHFLGWTRVHLTMPWVVSFRV